MHISRVIEALSCTPKALKACFCLLSLDVIGNVIELCVSLLEVAVLGREVAVMETEVLDRELVHDLESSVNLCLSSCSRVGLAPALVGSSYAEHICAVSAHSVPP